MTAPLKTVEGSGDIAATMRDIGRAPKPPPACWRWPRPSRRIARWPAWRPRSAPAKSDILAANAEDLADGKAAGLTAAVLDRLTLNDQRVEAMAEGLDVVRGLADPVGRVTESWTRPNGMTIERVQGAARRRRRDLREPAERHRRRRRADAQGRQRRDPARRLGQPSLVARDPCRADQGPARSQPAGGRDLAGADPRPRRGRHDAARPRRHHRRDRAARRQEPGRARADRSARAGVRASRRRLPRLCRQGRRRSTWPRPS